MVLEQIANLSAVQTVSGFESQSFHQQSCCIELTK